MEAFRAGEPAYVRITEKRRLAMAAAAIKTRIDNRRIPLVFLPVFPLRNGSAAVSAIVVVDSKSCRDRCGVSVLEA